jgi:hypothetical protein
MSYLIVSWNRSGKTISVWQNTLSIKLVLTYWPGPSRNEGLRRRRRSV